MLRRFLAIATMVCTLPSLANAAKGTLQIAPQSPGGNITAVGSFYDSNTNAYVDGTQVVVTSAYGTVYKNYSGAAKPSATINPNPGYNLTAYAVDNVAGAGVPTTNPMSVPGVTSKVTATFLYGGVSNVLSVTASAGTGGSVNMTNVANVYKGQTLIYPMTFKFMPKGGYQVTGITGAPAGTIINPAVSSAVIGQAVSVIFPAGYTFTGNVALAGSFTYTSTAPTAKVGAPQAVAPNNTVTLDGSASLGATSYLWTQTAGPVTATIANPTGATTAVTGLTAAGTYKFKLAVNSGSYAIATVNVTDSLADSMKTMCVDCHARNNIGGGYSASGVYANWAASVHVNQLPCATCHVEADTAGHPGATVTSATCASCHATVTNHTTATMGNAACTDCHDGHNPAITTGTLGPVTAHPAVTLYTFEEVGYQMNNGQPVPVQVDANGKGMPYSPKMTCGAAGCHIKNGVDYTYDKISDHAFHSSQGRSEMTDSGNGKFDATKNKPWLQSTAMVGKW